MINTIDLQECEILLPGDWTRLDSGDTWTFTTDKMQLRDERLFKELYIHKSGQQPQPLSYALTIHDEFCGILVDDTEFIILSIDSETDGAAKMEWQDSIGARIKFERAAGATTHV
jgi:hypothetical protein